MILRFFLFAELCLCCSFSGYSQSSISINSEYSIGEISSDEDYEYGYNVHLKYGKSVFKPWLSVSVGAFYLEQSLIAGGSPWGTGDVNIDGIWQEDVSTRIHAEGIANTILGTAGFELNRKGFSIGIFGGLGSSSFTSEWKYRVTQNGAFLSKQNFEEEYETKPTWLYGMKLAYVYPVTDRIGVGLSLSGSILDSAERKIAKTNGTYTPEDYYDPELTRNSATNYSESFILSGLIVEFRL